SVTVESDNKKEAKGVRGVKGRADQSRGIKAVLVNRVPPPHTVPVDTHRFRYVVDSQEEDEEDEEDWRSPAESMRKSLDTHVQFTAQWEGLIGVERQRSLADVEQLLMSCSAFIYSSIKSFFSCFPPVKMASLNLSGCQMVFLLDCGQSRVSVQKSSHRWALAGPVGSVYLMTLGGVRSVLLNQWQCSASANAGILRSLMDDLLNTGLTSGRAAHVLRTHKSERAEVSRKSSSLTDEASGVNVDSSSEDVLRKTPLSSSAFNFVIYGLPNLVVI
ncbi:hypothetical protein PO909_018948, partial [Leuciscus waleckii]